MDAKYGRTREIFDRSPPYVWYQYGRTRYSKYLIPVAYLDTRVQLYGLG